MASQIMNTTISRGIRFSNIESALIARKPSYFCGFLVFNKEGFLYVCVYENPMPFSNNIQHTQYVCKCCFVENWYSKVFDVTFLINILFPGFISIIIGDSYFVTTPYTNRALVFAKEIVKPESKRTSGLLGTTVSHCAPLNITYFTSPYDSSSFTTYEKDL